MKQYCRYCLHCIAQDEMEGVCKKTNRMVKKTSIRNACSLFDFCEVDAFYFNRSDNPEDAKYKPRVPKKTQCDGQVDMFSYLESKKEKNVRHILSAGEKIGRNVLGETRIATITKVEGLPDYQFYRTDSGCCYSYEEGLENIDYLICLAEEERKKYKTIIPCNLSERITVEYEPRKCDGVVLWAQIGIFENMFFWKEDVTYQFCVPFDSEKKLWKEYEERRKKILDDAYGTVRMLEQEKPMRRLYWSNHGMYADAEYVCTNG